MSEEIIQKISPIFRKYNVSFAGLFGSRARGDARPDSDYDFLVSFKVTPGLVKFIKMENELKDVLNSEVDLVVAGSEKPFVKENMEKDLTPIYGSR